MEFGTTTLSVIVPVYGTVSGLVFLIQKLSGSIPPEFEWDLILVDDNGDNASPLSLPPEFNFARPLQILHHPENLGQQRAIQTGLRAAQGRWSVVVSCDLQDPPELLPKMLDLARQGKDVVLGAPINRDVRGINSLLRNGYLFLVRTISGRRNLGIGSMYALITQDIARQFLNSPLSGIAFRVFLESRPDQLTYLEYEPAPRFSGKSGYTFWRRIRLSFQGIYGAILIRTGILNNRRAPN